MSIERLRDVQKHRMGASAKTDQETRDRFFDGWEEAKAAGPEAVEKWLNTPITRDQMLAFADLLEQ